MPQHTGGNAEVGERFGINYTFWLNLVALAVTGLFAWLAKSTGKSLGSSMAVGKGPTEKILLWLSIFAAVWLIGGVVAEFFLTGEGGA